VGLAPVEVRLREGVHQLMAASEPGIIPSLPKVALPPDSVALFKQTDEVPTPVAGKPV
jgi:hypothetical protein